MRRRRLVLATSLLILVAAAVVVGMGGAGAGASGSAGGAIQTGMSPRSVDAAAYAGGACILYPPTAGNRHRTVFLDAAGGVGAPSLTGTTASGRRLRGGELTLQIELDTVRLLRARGFTVVASRSGQGSVGRAAARDWIRGHLTAQGIHHDLAAREHCADQARADLLVGIDLGAGGPARPAGSLTSYDPQRPFAEQNLQLAQLVQGDVRAQLAAHGWRVPDGGVVPVAPPVGAAQHATAPTNASLMLLGPRSGFNPTPSAMPGALIVPLSLANRGEATIAAGRAGQQAIAAGLAEAVEQLLPRPPRTPPRPLAARFHGEHAYAKDTLGGVALARVWRVPPAGVGQGPITVAAFDPAHTRLVLHAGSVQPGAPGPWLNGPQIGPNERRQLVAAFNAGFKMPDSRGGWFSEGRTVVPLVRGAASVVIYADGGVDIGSWGIEVPAPHRVIASVRQNLQLLIDHGRPRLQHAADENQLELWWGVAFNAAPLISRSALGITADGTLVWAAGTDVTIPALTDALLAHGVVRAIELDINAPYPRGFLYPGPGTVTPRPSPPNLALPLVAGQTQTAADYTASGTGASSIPHCTYVTTCSRDFFTVITR